MVEWSGDKLQKLFKIGGLFFVALAFLRLLSLATVSRESGPGKAPGMKRVEKEIRLRVEGPKGDAIRLYFPDIPLNLDYPFGDGSVNQKLSLMIDRPLQRVTCQVIRGGEVVAESSSRLLGDGPLDLGTVECKSKP